ncbi:syntaxin-4 isoform X3 [Hippoglossus hippoglossus]|uniref:syntaxin-4 isoform X3 n=1 Tax=Hippoglossus hippoglossus TaxID=8267 RepID=UPI00148D0FD0|nr:syntaxin-4 isoform X3 [Hippoglossus hippoglossus]
MRDRTKELGNKAEDSDDENEDKALMITPGTSSAKEEKESEAFFKKVQEIHEGLQSLRRIVSELENKQKTVLGEALPMESMKKELQTLRDEFKTQASQIQKKLKSIESKKSEEDGKYVPINVRMQRTQHGVLCKEFVDLMGHCNTIQAQYRDRNVERIQRQLRITGNDVSDTQLEVMLESGQTDVFTQNVSTCVCRPGNHIPDSLSQRNTHSQFACRLRPVSLNDVYETICSVVASLVDQTGRPVDMW